MANVGSVFIQLLQNFFFIFSTFFLTFFNVFYFHLNVCYIYSLFVQNDVTALKLASVVNNYDVMRLLINHGGRLSAADAAAPLSNEPLDDQLSRIACTVLSRKLYNGRHVSLSVCGNYADKLIVAILIILPPIKLTTVANQLGFPGCLLYPRTWNDLPDVVTSAFCQRLKTHLSTELFFLIIPRTGLHLICL